jgi:hypothetical protein
MKIRDLDTGPSAVNDEHLALGLPPVEAAYSRPPRSRALASPHGAASAPSQRPGAADRSDRHPVVRTAMWLAAGMLTTAVGFMVWRLSQQGDVNHNLGVLGDALKSREFWSAVLVGLLAQTVDGALGMAYGITSTSFLLASGFSPAVASAGVHIAEVFTTGVSGIAHAKLGNVDRRLFVRLLVPGIIGAVAGALLLASVDGTLLKPWVSGYLLLMGLYVLSKAWRRVRARRGEAPRHVAKLALVGGFVDASGGGGWGPVVTTTLVGTGHDPRTTIGSVNFAEFFLTFATAIAFSVLIDEGPWLVVAGLVIGGLFAAPFAAFLVSRMPARRLLVLVGVLISAISAFNLWKALGG